MCVDDVIGWSGKSSLRTGRLRSGLNSEDSADVCVQGNGMFKGLETGIIKDLKDQCA